VKGKRRNELREGKAREGRWKVRNQMIQRVGVGLMREERDVERRGCHEKEMRRKRSRDSEKATKKTEKKQGLKS